MNKSISIIGCGWLGLPLAQQMASNGWLVNGTTTTTTKLHEISTAGAKAYLLNLNAHSATEELADLFAVDVMLIAIPPRTSTSGDQLHAQHIQWLLDQVSNNPCKVIYISSTSVYPEVAGTFDENFNLDESNSGSKAIWHAEQNVLKHSAANIILRCSGLLGYNRVAGRYFAGKQAPGRQQPVNYVHRDDVIGIIGLILQHPESSGIFNIVCPQHPTREEVYLSNSKKLGFDMPMWQSEGIERIIQSVKISTFGYVFKYPDPREFF